MAPCTCAPAGTSHTLAGVIQHGTVCRCIVGIAVHELRWNAAPAGREPTDLLPIRHRPGITRTARGQLPRSAISRVQHLARRREIPRRTYHAAIRWKPVAATAALAVAIASMAEGSPARHLARPMQGAASEASGLVIKTHGSHTACRYGSYRKTTQGWHRHDRGAAYPCAPRLPLPRNSPAPLLLEGARGPARRADSQGRRAPRLSPPSVRTAREPKTWHVLVGHEDRPHPIPQAALSGKWPGR